MSTLKQRYSELLHLTQLHLLREYSSTTTKTVDPALFAYFQRNNKSFPAQPSPSQHINMRPEPPVIPPATPSPSQQPMQKAASPPTHHVPPSSPPPQIIQKPHSPPAQAPIVPPQQSIANPQTNTKVQPRKEKGFILEAPKLDTTPRDLREYWKICSEVQSDIKLSETIPCDAKAKKTKEAWLKNHEIPPVVILSFKENEQQLAFIKNIAQAISVRLAQTKIIIATDYENENKWETLLKQPQLRLIISSDYGLYLQPNLMKFYKEDPGQNKHNLNHIPLLLLSDLSLYLKEPRLKRHLWRSICNDFASIS